MQNNGNTSCAAASTERDFLSVLVMDDHCVRWAPEIDDWNAGTVLACVSEDPADWSEIVAVWPRYRTGPSLESADSLPVERVTLDAALPQLRPGEPWLVLDLRQKRILSSAAHGDVQRDGCFRIGPADRYEPELQMPVHLPPWWEIHNGARPHQVRQPRASAIRRPSPRRDILWGPPLADALARGMLAVYRSREWEEAGASTDRRARYRFTVRVHRDWLMTPRDDLGGRIPRDSLHGGMTWIERVIEGQQPSVVRGKAPLPVAPHLSSYRAAPMGRAEVCMYFDACRAMIDAGWQWLIDHDRGIAGGNAPAVGRRLAARLGMVQHRWMNAPFEGGSPPVAIIQNERDRVPEVAGGGEDGHMIDCDCPICRMMADGAFGPCFVFFDGHHLELDDEFAFSLCESREEWAAQQREFAEMSSAIDAQRNDENERTEATGELGSAWQNSFVADDLPGDPLGHLGLSFRLAEIVNELQAQSGPQADVDALNQAFSDYRRADPADPDQRSAASERLKHALERIAERYPSLVSRTADLQSTVDDLLRRPVPADIDDDVAY